MDFCQEHFFIVMNLDCVFVSVLAEKGVLFLSILAENGVLFVSIFTDIIFVVMIYD